MISGCLADHGAWGAGGDGATEHARRNKVSLYSALGSRRFLRETLLAPITRDELGSRPDAPSMRTGTGERSRYVPAALEPTSISQSGAYS